jgi:hypothetical protein
MGVTSFLELQNFKQKTVELLNAQIEQNPQPITTIFFSFGGLSSRCKVWHTTDVDSQVAIKRTIRFIEKIFEKNRSLPKFLKFDFAVNVQQHSFQEIQKQVSTQPHNNHYRKGLSLDEKFSICFLEQEIYGKSIIKGLIYNQPNFFDEKNLNDAIKNKYSHITKTFHLAQLDRVWSFDTLSAFYENNVFVELQSTGPQNGIRKVEKNLKNEIRELIIKNAAFLHGEILESGRFVYGYFPAYDRELKSYNTVRHCTAIYALLETLEVDYQETYLIKIRQAIEYALQNFYKEVHGLGFMTDGENDSEIKLGSNAAAIFMFAKYQEITSDDRYLHIAETLAEGIQSMVDEQGETTHVLHYPSLETKEKFRIVYYDGEAALGLLRLYQLNQDKQLLDTVKLMFEHFITKNYDKYHDHWLSYCTNELTKICPEEKYFQFGLNNYLKHMKFIAERKTAYATFLEMMMSAYKMVVRMREQGYDTLFEQAQFEALKQLIEQRVEFQRSTGMFYPEAAMYMAKPQHILNAFYVRHDRLRTRIDDQEHNLSGYVAFINHFA